MNATSSEFSRRRAGISSRPFLEANEAAIRAFESSYGAIAQAFEECKGPVNDLIGFLRLVGFRCSSCGSHVTFPIVRFFRYQANVLCWTCQDALKRK